MTTIHLISHTHWDREWYLTFQQFRVKLVHLVDHLLDILERDPGFQYFLLDGQTIILEDYLEIRPERREQLTTFITNGRILIGPWYVSPDEYLVSPELHIRNLLEGDKLCQALGGKMQVGYLPDDFGHIGQMPQILEGFGIDSACVWRGLDDQPCELEWKAPDGSTVLLAYLRDSYSNGASLTPSISDKFVNEINSLSGSLADHSILGEVLLMQGTDHMEPLNDLSTAIVHYQHLNEPNSLIHSSLPLYFTALRSKLTSTNNVLPVLRGELRSSKHSALLQNVLSTRILLKQRNHICETDLLKWVEPLDAWIGMMASSTTASGSAGDNPSPITLNDQKTLIRHAWKLLMQCHPHDSICGTSLDQVAIEMRTRFDQVDQISQVLIDQSLEKLCDQIDTRIIPNPNQDNPDDNILTSVVVFNPNDAPQTGLVNLCIKLSGHYDSFEIINREGQPALCDFSGMGSRELISLVLDKRTLKQAFRMIHEGHIAGMVVRDFEIDRRESYASVHATLSDHGNVNINRWREGVAQMDEILADPLVTEFHIHAFSDPEIQLSFVARDIPQHGFSCYWIRGRLSTEHELVKPVKLNPIVQSFIPIMARLSRLPILSRLLGGKKRRSDRMPKRIENEYFLVEAEVTDGTLTIIDKRTKQVYRGLNRFVDSGDRGDLYNYCPLQNDQFISPELVKVVHDELNSNSILTLHYRYELPKKLADDRASRGHEWVTNTAISTITIITGVPRVDIHTEIENQAQDHRLRVHFPAPFSCMTSMQDGHFEIVERPVGLPPFDETWEEPPRPEVPQRQFTSISDGHTSLTIANLGLPEVEVCKNQDGNSEIAITLLRCVGWLSRDDLTTRKNHAGPMEVAVPEAQMLGKYSFDYSIIPGSRDWREAIPHAIAFNVPLRSMTASVHEGSLPGVFSLIENSNVDFMITSVKAAEDGAGMIIRGYNSLSSPIDVSLKLKFPIKRVLYVRLDEQSIESIPISPNGSIDIHIGGYKIITLRILT